MRGLLVDLDRTLIDVQSYTDYEAALRDLKDLVSDWPDVTTPNTGWSGPTRACMEVLVALSGDQRWAAVSDTVEQHELVALSRATAMPGLTELVQAVNGYPVAVVTLLGPEATTRVLAAHEVPFVITVPRRPDLRPKPAPDQLLEASRLLYLSPRDVAMVGDSTWDLEAARAAGTGFIGVTNHRSSEFPPGTETVADLVELSARLRESLTDT